MDPAFLFACVVLWAAGFSTGVLMRGLMGLWLTELRDPEDWIKDNPWPPATPLRVLMQWLPAAALYVVALVHWVLVLAGVMVVGGADFPPDKRAFGFWAYTVTGAAAALAALLLVRPYDDDTSRGMRLQGVATQAVYYVPMAAAHVFVAARAAPFDIVAYVANACFLVAQAWVALHRRRGRARVDVVVNDKPGRVLRLEGVSYPTILAWSCLSSDAALRYFEDTPRFGCYVVAANVLPLMLALAHSNKHRRRELWFHYRVLCEHAFWLAVFFFPLLSLVDGALPEEGFLLGRWAAAQDQARLHYLLAVAAMVLSVGAAAV
jgi:hypothetical protein